VYAQTRSIVGSVRHLYSVGSHTAATLILFFSIIVPLTKSLLVSWAVLQSDSARRQHALFFVEMIAKWSMADVFAVAVMIAYLAAQASQSADGSIAIVVFDASFGSGFYWFAGYCLTSLAVQQITARWLMTWRINSPPF
jgi:paraquat-inducible protein A